MPARKFKRRSPGHGSGALPDREGLLAQIAASGTADGRDLARALGVKGRDRTALKRMLRDLEAQGALPDRPAAPRRRDEGGLPPVAVLEVSGMAADGELLARPVNVAEHAEAPAIVVASERGRAPAVGDRILARLSRRADGYEAQVMRVLPAQPARFVGEIERARDGLRVRPAGSRGAGELRVRPADSLGAEPGELVVVERLGAQVLGPGYGRVTERLGEAGDSRTVSLLAAHTYDLPMAFSAAALRQAEAARPVVPGPDRRDLRDLPLVTIDGADARDFDDAVFAKRDGAGWHLVVAIADVAHYVRPGDALDLEARERGNSVYFPDRVLPMLPEALSSGLCSLRPGEDRACLAAHLWLDASGRVRRHRFERGLMRSQARLTYEQVQAAADGALDDLTGPLTASVVEPLYGAFAALLAAREQRGTLDLDVPEVQILLDGDGRPVGARGRARLDSHRLIEEMMIAANVAAAETLEQAAAPCMYRVHDRPDPVKIEALVQLLQSLGLARGRGVLAKPKDLTRLIRRLESPELVHLVSTMVLRAQSQAVYSPHNLGHFGLNLGRYAHFTSPIRRYADLVVHRSLIRALKLGEGGLERAPGGEDWAELGTELSRRERRAMEAERTATDRFLAILMASEVGSSFAATVTGVQRFGLFVQLDETMAEGLVPIGRLGEEYFSHDPVRQALRGERSGRVFALGDRLRVELTEVDLARGQLTFRLLAHDPGPAAITAGRARPRNIKPGRARRKPGARAPRRG
jgi:ribonuclease R